jgi:hypothetical protein
MSCNDVEIRKLKKMLARPVYLRTFAECLWGIFFDILIKKIPKATEWKNMPMSAHTLEGFTIPFIAFSANKLHIKFFDQSKPVEFLSGNEPPG